MTTPPSVDRHDSAAAAAPGRYAVFDPIAAGGMATVHLGRMLGAAGFARTVAIKRLHPARAADAAFVAMFVDEARLASRIRHPNVVATLDVVATGRELFHVMEYVPGETLAGLLRAAGRIPPAVASAVVCGMLDGLHAAHEAKSERGAPLGLVHRDVSPSNVVVGGDGIARLLDFGIAKAAGRQQITRQGELKGKIRYMAPEQLLDEPVTRSCDVYAAGATLWELLTGEPLHRGTNEAAVIAHVLSGTVRRPSELVAELPPAIDAVALRALARAPGERFATAREMAVALERAEPPASPRAVGEWVEAVAAEALAARARIVARIEADGDAESIRASDPASQRDGARAPAADRPTVTLTAHALGAILGAVRDEADDLAPTVERRSRPTSDRPAAGDATFVFPLERSRGPGRAAAALALVAALAGVAWLAWRRGAASEVAHAQTASLQVPAIEPAATSAVAAPAPAPSASTPSAPPAAKPSSAAAAGKPGAARCNPPYYVDERGLRRIKPECI